MYTPGRHPVKAVQVIYSFCIVPRHAAVTVHVALKGLREAVLIPESPLAREAVSEPLREPSDIWRLITRGVVWAGVVAPGPTEPALSWRVRGPGALRRLRVLLRRDLRRRVGGGCTAQSPMIA